jgi:hypothetical protein
LPLLGDAAAAVSEIQVDETAERLDTGASSSKTAAAGASGRRSVGSNRQRLSPQRFALHVASAASSRPQQSLNVSSQPQQQPEASAILQGEHYSYVDLSDAAASTSHAGYAGQPQQQYQQQYQQQCSHEATAMSSSLYSSSAAANTALAGARAAAAAGGSLDARTYYESVAPSTWRPADAEAAAPGDYLELYRCVAQHHVQKTIQHAHSLMFACRAGTGAMHLSTTVESSAHVAACPRPL